MNRPSALRLTQCVLLIASSAFAQTTILETYGDSLTHGFLTNTHLDNTNPDEVRRTLVDFAKYFATKKEKYMGPHVKPDLAWPQHLADRWSTPEHSYVVQNMAWSGSKAKEMIDQVKKAPLSWKPVVAFFFMGHNDMCHNAREPEALGENFGVEYETAIEEWDKRHDGSTAYLLPVGQVYKVYDVLRDYVWFKGKLGEYKCANSWKTYFPYCVSYYKMALQNKLNDFLKPRIDSMNVNLSKLADKWNSKSAKNHFRYVNEVAEQEMEVKYFALDCYHLSETGQNAFAEKLQAAIDEPK